jgi:hypothetical protein
VKARRDPPTEEQLLDALRAELFAAPEWIVLSQVRSSTGAAGPGLRIADGIAVHLYPGPGLRLVGFEVKRYPGDCRSELAHPEKSLLLRSVCEQVYLVVPAPRKDVVSSLPEAHGAGFGVIEVGTGGAVILAEAPHPSIRPFEPPSDLLRALFRSASDAVAREVSGEGDAPLRAIVGTAERGFVVLSCGDQAVRPLAKRMPARIPCWACAERAAEGPSIASCPAPEPEAERRAA